MTKDARCESSYVGNPMLRVTFCAERAVEFPDAELKKVRCARYHNFIRYLSFVAYGSPNFTRAYRKFTAVLTF